MNGRIDPTTEHALQRFVPTKLAMTDLAYDVVLETGLYISPLPVWTYEWEHPEEWLPRREPGARTERFVA
jgi:hypothetical protein